MRVILWKRKAGGPPPDPEFGDSDSDDKEAACLEAEGRAEALKVGSTSRIAGARRLRRPNRVWRDRESTVWHLFRLIGGADV